MEVVQQAFKLIACHDCVVKQTIYFPSATCNKSTAECDDGTASYLIHPLSIYSCLPIHPVHTFVYYQFICSCPTAWLRCTVRDCEIPLMDHFHIYIFSSFSYVSFVSLQRLQEPPRPRKILPLALWRFKHIGGTCQGAMPNQRVRQYLGRMIMYLMHLMRLIHLFSKNRSLWIWLLHHKVQHHVCHTCMYTCMQHVASFCFHYGSHSTRMDLIISVFLIPWLTTAAFTVCFR